ncbi:MAG: hypothetical protein KC766_40135 [Myxococcales bacterium]|nr:hypothetical protein [Myxococcales bacterium]
MPRRRLLRWATGVAIAVPALWFGVAWLRYPSDKTPEGAYLRVMSAVNRDHPEDFFPYIETEAQHACYTLRDYKKQARDRVLAAYPEPERGRLAKRYEQLASAPDGKDVFAIFARELGWMDRLRKDLSAVAKVEVQGERASVQTVRGTRYPFRRRDNGIWGLTLFTAFLVAEAEKAARDFALIDKAAKDYERAGGPQRPSP